VPLAQGDHSPYPAPLHHPIKHQHIHHIAHSHVALAVVQHDEAVGLHHAGQDAAALVAGSFDLQAAVGGAGDLAALVFGAAGFFAQTLARVGLQVEGGAGVFGGVGAHHAQERRAYKGQHGDHHGYRVARQAEGYGTIIFVVGLTHADAAAGDDGVGLGCGAVKRGLQQGLAQALCKRSANSY
jgi:hypothetical protein